MVQSCHLLVRNLPLSMTRLYSTNRNVQFFMKVCCAAVTMNTSGAAVTMTTSVSRSLGLQRSEGRPGLDSYL